VALKVCDQHYIAHQVLIGLSVNTHSGQRHDPVSDKRNFPILGNLLVTKEDS